MECIGNNFAHSSLCKPHRRPAQMQARLSGDREYILNAFAFLRGQIRVGAVWGAFFSPDDGGFSQLTAVNTPNYQKT
jgi:hypothetical protein